MNIMGEPLGQVIILYLFFVGIVSILYLIARKLIKNRVILYCYLFVLISPFLIYVPVEVRTFLYGDQFKNVEIDTGLNGPVVYYKVFSITESEAKLFFVEGENGYHGAGMLYGFVKEDGEWQFASWEGVVWTNYGGSASEFTVPPYF